MIGHVRETHENCERISCIVCDLYVCKVCGCLEGSLLPFARCTFDTIDVAKSHCYDRLHPKPWIDSSKGARLLYDAVCDLWNWTLQQKTCAICSERKGPDDGGMVQPANVWVCNVCTLNRVCP